MADVQGPVRSVLYLQAKPGMRDQLVDVFRRIDVPGNALQQEGCLSVEVHVPPDADGPIMVTALWTHRAAYDGWLANPWREYSGQELEPFLAGDTQGFPNGRRLADDVLDISLQAVAGELTGNPNDLGDGVNLNDVKFSDTFPNLAPPHAGSRPWKLNPVPPQP